MGNAQRRINQAAGTSIATAGRPRVIQSTKVTSTPANSLRYPMARGLDPAPAGVPTLPISGPQLEAMSSARPKLLRLDPCLVRFRISKVMLSNTEAVASAVIPSVSSAPTARVNRISRLACPLERARTQLLTRWLSPTCMKADDRRSRLRKKSISG